MLLRLVVLHAVNGIYKEFIMCLPISNVNSYSLKISSPFHGVTNISYSNFILAIILDKNFKNSGINFFTPSTFSQQLGYMNRPKGYNISPHDHNAVIRTIEWTQETLFIRSGHVRLDLYAPNTRSYLCSHDLYPGDVVLLAHGGHGFHMLEASEIVEVKQGPYAGEADKTRFYPHDGPLAGGSVHE